MNEKPQDQRNEAIKIGDVVVQPGTQVTVDLPVADLYTHSSLAMPVQVVHGRRAGPVLFVTAAVHGDEICGTEILRRLLKRKALRSLRGTLLAVPVVNVHGFLDQSRYLPDRRDLNRSFPGSASGSLAARTAHVVATEILSKADYGIDLHTGAVHRANLPQIRADLGDPRTLELAKIFGTPIVLNSNVRDGSLREHAAKLGIPTLLYETGEALRFDEVGIRGGIRGIGNVMRAIGMLSPAKTKMTPIESVISSNSRWVRAPISGLMISRVRLGERVREGDRLAVLSDPYGETEEAVISPMTGMVIGRSNLPLAHEGDALMHIAMTEGGESAEHVVAQFKARHDENTPT